MDHLCKQETSEFYDSIYSINGKYLLPSISVQKDSKLTKTIFCYWITFMKILIIMMNEVRFRQNRYVIYRLSISSRFLKFSLPKSGIHYFSVILKQKW